MDKFLIGDWISLVTALGVVVAMVSAIYTLIKSGQKSGNENTETITEMRTDIKHIKNQVDHMSKIPERLTAVEESAKQAHKRIDRLENGVGI